MCNRSYMMIFENKNSTTCIPDAPKETECGKAPCHSSTTRVLVIVDRSSWCFHSARRGEITRTCYGVGERGKFSLGSSCLDDLTISICWRLRYTIEDNRMTYQPFPML